MIYIAIIAIAGILLLQLTDAIPLASVGGPLVIGLAYIAAAPAVAIHEAWTKKRGVLGWIVNIIVAFIGVVMTAQIGGLIMVFLLAPFTTGQSLAHTGGAVMSIALVGEMLFVLAGAWGALQLLNRWRDKAAQAHPDSLPT